MADWYWGGIILITGSVDDVVGCPTNAFVLLYDNARKVRRMCLTSGLVGLVRWVVEFVTAAVVFHNCRNNGANVSADKRRIKALG